MSDFYISHSGSDREWAEWIAWQLKNLGYSFFLGQWQLKPGENFQLSLSKAINKARFVIVVISPDYFASNFAKGEWAAVLETLPLIKEKNRLIPILVREIDVGTFLLPSISYINLVGIDQSQARQQLLAGIKNFMVNLDKELEQEADSPTNNQPLIEVKQSYGDINVEFHKTINFAISPPVFPTHWASEWGEDEFGLYVDLDFQGVIQRFRWIAPGSFLMGSPETELERRDDETQHEVTLTQGFWLANSACTQALWQAVLVENLAEFKDTPDHPVENVNWNDVQRFIQALNTQVPGLHARLPSEAEWEYACRADTTTPFSFGETITPAQVNYHGNYPYAGAAKGLYREKTIPVKSLPPNSWGLYEMHGNVWEWCSDWYGAYPTTAVTDPLGPATGVSRVLRGGSWSRNARRARSADRYWFEPVPRSIIGFRLALGPGRGSNP